MTYLNTSKLTRYTSSDTWNKDSRSKYITVIVFNSGSSGASGRKGASTAAGGGGGGGGGSGCAYSAPALFFGTSETVTIGAPTTGALGQTSDANNGINGSVGNLSIFGNLLGSVNIGIPTGGTTTSAAGGASRPILFQWNTGAASTPTAGAGSNVAGSSPAVIATNNNYLTGSSGAGGGGYDTAVERAGGTGSGFSRFDLSAVILAGGLPGTESGTINGGNGNPPSTTNGGMITGGSGGGGGGGPKVGTTAGNGGNGAAPGGGGGGGGGGISAVATSGAGGNGARGEVIVIEFF